jgi:hypothetical protein
MHPHAPHAFLRMADDNGVIGNRHRVTSVPLRSTEGACDEAIVAVAAGLGVPDTLTAAEFYHAV